MITAKIKLLCFCVVSLWPIGGAFAEEVILSPSPDGKFALRLTSAFGGSAAVIIDAKSQMAITGEEDLHVSTEHPTSDGATRLVWSADSKRAAYRYTEHNRNNAGNSVQVFAWNGAQFKEVLLPDLPKPKAKASSGDGATSHFEKRIPLRWLKPTTLVLSDEVEMGNDPAWKRIITIAFDAEGNAKVQKVEQKKDRR